MTTTDVDHTARMAVTAAVLKRDPEALVDALAALGDEATAVCAAMAALARADTATRDWWSAPEQRLPARRRPDLVSI